MEKNTRKCIKMAVIAINFTFIISPSKWLNFNVQFLPFFPSQAALRLEKNKLLHSTLSDSILCRIICIRLFQLFIDFYHVYSVISFGDS